MGTIAARNVVRMWRTWLSPSLDVFASIVELLKDAQAARSPDVNAS